MTALFEIEPNRRFIIAGRTLIFKRAHQGEECPYIFEDEKGFPLTFGHEQLRQARERNELTDWKAPSPAVVSADKVIYRARVTIDSATETERFAIERHQAYINAWLARRETPRSERGLSPLIEAVYARRVEEARLERRYEPPRLSVSRVQQLIRKYLDGGEVADALVPQTRLRGNYRQRLNQTVMDIVQRQIDEVYLTTKKQSVAGLQHAVGEAINQENSRLRGARKLPKPSYEAITRVVNGLCKYTVAYCREGEQTANMRYRLIGSGIVTERMNEVWEIDDTRVDLICLHEDGKTVIGRPWMTIVIDRHTRMIMSFVLSFSPPDTESALEAVRLAIHGKNRFPGGSPDLRDKWPAEGRPDAIHVDNGKQYNSKAFKRGVTQLGIQHNTLPVLKAWYKGTVERAIGTVMRQVFHLVPGTTYSNIFDRDRETPPEQVAVATLAVARAKLLAWVVNEYQHRHHRGIGDSPFAIWHRSVAQHRLRMPFVAEQVDAALSITVARTLRHGNIELDGLRYLTAHGLRLEMAPGCGSQREVIVRRDPADLTVVQFLDAGVSDRSAVEWYPAYICAAHRSRVEGRSLEHYQLARQIRANSPVLANDDPTWDLTYKIVDSNQDEDASSQRLSVRVRAEGRRERAVGKARRSVESESFAGLNDGEDLQARLEAADSPVLPREPSPAPEQDDEEYSLEKLRAGNSPRSRHRAPKDGS